MASDHDRALAVWEGRFKTGWRGQERTRPLTWVYDDLWRAACWEVAAQEAAATGNTDAAVSHRRRATAILTGVRA